MTVLPPKEDRDLKPITFRVPHTILEEMREIAASENLALNELVIHMLKAALVEVRKELAERNGNNQKEIAKHRK